MEGERLSGGNTHEAIIRIGDTVRRPAGPWTPSVHALLRHLEEAGFEGAPRALGMDDEGREILSYVEGDVVYPEHRELIATDAALASVARTIRELHDATSTFAAEGHTWSDAERDPTGADEIVCHNDLGTWNLLRTAQGWAFIDWDMAAPGRLSWDLGLALTALVPFFTGAPHDDETLCRRIAVFADAYGGLPADVIEGAHERAVYEVNTIRARGAAGETPWARLLRDGHAEGWEKIAARIEANMDAWTAAVPAR